MNDQNDAADVRAALDAMNGALVAQDIPTLEHLFVDDYIFTSPIGTTLDKAMRIESVRSGARKISSLTFPDLRLQLYRDAAITTGRYIEVVEPQHIEQSGLITNVLVRLDGVWRVAAGHSFSAAVTQSSSVPK